jgi:hypothetical protein
VLAEQFAPVFLSLNRTEKSNSQFVSLSKYTLFIFELCQIDIGYRILKSPISLLSLWLTG